MGLEGWDWQWHLLCIFTDLPSRELTYPTNGKGNSSSQLPLDEVGGYVSSQEGTLLVALEHRLLEPGDILLGNVKTQVAIWFIFIRIVMLLQVYGERG